MKVIFLDVDGVLNSTKHAMRVGGYGRFAKANTFAKAKLSPDALDNLRTILQKTDASIVISSTWRLNRTIDDLKWLFEVHEIDPERVIDSLPEDVGNESRGALIATWLEKHPEVTQYVILDDDDDMLDSQAKHFVQTDITFGLTALDAKVAIGILTT